MAISDWPTDQRPREKMATLGAQALSDPELLALFLRTGVAGKNAIELGRDMLTHFGSLTKLFSASAGDFAGIKGIGPAKLALMQAVLEIARRVCREELQTGSTMDSPQAVSNFLRLQFTGQPNESFVALFLDVQNRLIACTKLWEGTLTRTVVYPREIVRMALAHNAAAVIFAHNHPSGRAEPSALDKSVTRDLKRAMDCVEVTMVDHIIVCGTKTWSFREQGALGLGKH